MKQRKFSSQTNKPSSVHLSRNNNYTADHYIRLYDDYLKYQRGLSVVYRRHLCRVARSFFHACFGSELIDTKLIAPNDVKNFVYQYASRVSPSSTQNIASGLRSLLKFLKFKNFVTSDFSAAIPPIARWKGDRMPSYLSDQEVAILLQHCNTTTPAGLMDYTIVCLILGLGLRASEVAKLTLDDIDWSNGEIIVKGKGQVSSKLPLAQKLGNDLVLYLRNGRPFSSSRFFFISFQPPFGGLNSITITKIIEKAFKRAGLKKKGKAHLLRHTFATKLINRGSSLQGIGMLLRHKCINTTAIYAKVDFSKLRSLALPWPGNLTFGGTL